MIKQKNPCSKTTNQVTGLESESTVACIARASIEDFRACMNEAYGESDGCRTPNIAHLCNRTRVPKEDMPVESHNKRHAALEFPRRCRLPIQMAAAVEVCLAPN